MRAGGAFVGLGRHPGGLAILLAVLAFVLVAAVLTIPAGHVLGSPAAAGESSPTLVLFHGEGCPHCAAERAWLQELAIEYIPNFWDSVFFDTNSQRPDRSLPRGSARLQLNVPCRAKVI